MDKLYIIVPAYNEEENIQQVVNEWYPVVSSRSSDGGSRLVVIDDGSRDETYHILEKMSVSLPLLTVLTKPNSGHGPTLLFGYHYALSHGADYVFQTDSDGQTSPREFESFWQKRESYEALFGMRPERGDGPVRAFVEKVLCLILRVIFQVSIPDANAPYRLMSASYLKRYLPRMPKDYNLPNVMLTVYGAYEGRNIRFLPITFGARRAGVNSVNMKKITKTGFFALRDFIILRKRMKR